MRVSVVDADLRFMGAVAKDHLDLMPTGGKNSKTPGEPQ